MLLIAGAGEVHTQINDPVPEPIEPAGILLTLTELIQFPASGDASARARINLLREVNDGSGRLFVNDLQGLFYSVADAEWDLYLSLKREFPDFIASPGRGTGFGAFAFHPEFAVNGKFYTSHAERAGSAPADFTPVEHNGIALQWTVYEWTCDDPSAERFAGDRREIMRLDFPTALHGIQEIAFNPIAVEGDADFGMLYVCIGDGGSSRDFFEGNLQQQDSYLGTIFRIDPAGRDAGNGKYGIPPDNPYAGLDQTVEEVWLKGFRNPHRISWDPATANMFIGDIGEMNIEEINIGIRGGNYGWPYREGTFLYDRATGRENVYPLPEDDSLSGYTYPATMYDHDEGRAVVGGYTYRLRDVPDLDGMLVFGDIVNGRIFAVPADSLTPEAVTLPREILLLDSLGNDLSLVLPSTGRADLRFGQDLSGNLYFLTKSDGKIRRIKEEATTAIPALLRTAHRFILSPNPARDFVNVLYRGNSVADMELVLFDAQGKLVDQTSNAVQGGQINLENLSPGMYLIRIRTPEIMETHKIIKLD